jgi:hypothetical protein
LGQKPTQHQSLRCGEILSKVGRTFSSLTRPARKDVEVLVYGGKWWRQAPTKTGGTTTRIHFGTEQTKKGTEFQIVAMTTAKPRCFNQFSVLAIERNLGFEARLIASRSIAQAF